MGIMGFLRNRMGLILVIVIGFALFAFIAGEVIHYGSSFFHGDANVIGEVEGDPIAYPDFNAQVEEATANFQQQSRQSDITPQITAYIQENTWNTIIRDKVFGQEMDKLGITVGDDERKSLIQGDNPAPQIVQAFGNPQTGQVDRAKLNNFLSNITTSKADTAMSKRWDKFVGQIVDAKREEKYMALVTNGLYVNSLDATDDYNNKNKLVNFKYVKLDYSSIPDKNVTVSDDDYQNYYNEHKGEFNNQQELRSIEYVSFDASPTKADSGVIEDQVAKLIPAFKASTNDSLFVAVNATTQNPIVFQHKGQLEPKIDTVMFNSPKGTVFGPYLSGGSYKIAKLDSIVIGPDSVKAKHILLPVANGVASALKTADSLKKLILAGKSFADLAKEYSTDKGSADKGGELGTFARGMMVPVFEDAVFNGKPGDIKIVTSQFGVHVIQIEEQKGTSKVVKVAIVDKPLAASTNTQTAAYSKAQTFLGNISGDNFEQEAAKSGVKPQMGNDINGTASAFGTVTNAREAVRWAYKAEVGDISNQVFTIGDQYIVARLMQIKPKGQLKLDDVKKQIAPQVLLYAKGKMLTEKMQAAVSGASNISQVSQKLNAPVTSQQNVVFSNPVIPGSAAEYKVVGTIFGSQPGKLSKPVAGVSAAYVFAVDDFVKPAPLTNAVREKQEIGQAILQRSQEAIFEALKDKANVKDYRSKFL